MIKKQLRKKLWCGFAIALTAAMVTNSTLPTAAVFASEFSASESKSEFFAESPEENVEMDESTGDVTEHMEANDSAKAFSAGDAVPAMNSQSELQERIDKLPTVEEFKAMADGSTTKDSNLSGKQMEIYDEVQAIADKFDEMSDEEQVQIDISKLQALSEYFNDQTEVMTIYSDDRLDVTEDPGTGKITSMKYTFTTKDTPDGGEWMLHLWKQEDPSKIIKTATLKMVNKIDSNNGIHSIIMNTEDVDFVLGQSYMLGMVLYGNEWSKENTNGMPQWPELKGICDPRNVSDLTKDNIYVNGVRSKLSLTDLTKSEHVHNWSYNLEDASKTSILASCGNTDCYYSETPKLNVNAATITYGDTCNVEVDNSITNVTGDQAGEITYEGKDTAGNSYGPTTTAPVNAGIYTASITLGGKTASSGFEIKQKELQGNIKENTVTYDGEAHGFIVEVTEPEGANYTVYYKKDDDSEYTTTEPTFTNPGTYTVEIKVVSRDGNYADLTGTAQLVINPKNFSERDIAVASHDETYDGQSHKLISVETTGTAEGAVITYSTTQNGEYTSEVPKGTNVGTYDVWYKVSKHGYEDYIGKVTADITTRELHVKPKAGQSKVYGTADPKNFEYEIEGLQTDADREEASKLEVKITRDPGEDVGLYKFIVEDCKIEDSPLKKNYDYNGLSKDAPMFEITPADSKYQAPEAVPNLTYNGEKQTLITAGKTADGKMQYKVNDGDWSYELPTGLNAGEYKVYYKVEGDKNHNGFEAREPLTVNIAKKSVTVTANDAEKHVGFEDPELTYTTSSEEGLIDGEELNGISLSRKEGETAGSYEITVEIKSEGGKDANPNYTVELNPGTFTIHDHEWGDWKTLNEATAWSEGKKEAQCTYKDENGKECVYVKYESIPKTGEKEDANKGKLEKDAQVAPEIQKQIKSATLGSTESEILHASGIFDDTERKEITDGSQKAKVWVELSGIDPKSLPADDQKAILEEAGKLSTDNEKLVYFNAELFRRIGNGAAKKIEDPKMNMKLTVRIPDEFLTDDSYVIRDYKVIRLHNGNAEILDGRFDQTTKEFTFETDKFSTYVLAYKDTYYSPSYPVTDVTISQDTATLTKEGETLQLTATVKPSYADNKNLTWKSSDEKVATVDENGKVTAVANGTAVITATSADGKHSASVTVTVNIPVPTATPTPTATPAPTETPEPTATPAPEQKKLTVKANKTTLTKIGDSLQITAKVEPADSDVKLIWKSSNEKVAIVDANGKVTAAGTGTAKITVTTEDGSLKESVTVTVKVPDEPTVNKTTGFGRLRARSTTQTNNSIKIQWNKVSGADGYIIYGNYCNANGKTYKYSKLKTITNGSTTAWTQTKLKKGTFYKYIVKAYKVVNGKKVITDTSASIHVTTAGGKYGVAKSVSVTKIGSKKNTLAVTLKNGKTAQITASEVKKDKKIKQHRGLCYESSNTKVATVTPDGLIQATGKGSCTVWVYAQNGVYKAITVTVK